MATAAQVDATADINPLLEAALRYRDKGLPVFPCNPDNKRPLTEHGFQDASNDPDVIRGWWERWPTAMIGIPTGERSKTWVLDIDDPEAFESACLMELPPTRRCETGKGYHLYFTGDPSIRNAQKTAKGWPFPSLPGAEVRGEGGYVIVPPSIHPNGRAYAWSNEGAIVDAPAALLRIVRKQSAGSSQQPSGEDTAYGLSALDGECQAIRDACDGEQEGTLNEAALKIGALVAGGHLSMNTARGRLIAAGLAMSSYNPRDPWTLDSVVAKVERGLADGMHNPRGPEPRDWRSSRTQQDVPKSRRGQQRPALPLEWCGDITPQLTGLWLVKRLLPALGLVLIYGHPGSGKSFLALDIAFHVALGWDWCGRKVKQGLVIYVGAEGLAGLRNRIFAFRQHYGLADEAIPLGLVPTAIDLQAHDADTPRLIELIRDAAEQCGYEPALIIVDTLSKTFGAGKENTDDMATYVANCGHIANAFDCCVMPVHHRPKDADSTEPRGHGSLKGGMDTVILVEAGLTKKATVTKQKDGETGDQTLFTLLPIELGKDEDGEDVTSCVLQQATVDMNLPVDPIARARAKLSDKNKVVLAALGKALEHDGELVPAEIPDSVINRMSRTKVASLDAWRTRALSGLRTGPDNNPDSDRRTFDRAKVKLQSLGIVGVWEEFAWEF